MGSPTNKSAADEMTRRLADREGERKPSLDWLESYYRTKHQCRENNTTGSDAMSKILAPYAYKEREEKLRLANETNVKLNEKLNETVKLVQELLNNSIQQKRKLQENEGKLAELAKLEEEKNKSHRTAMLEAEDVIKRKQGVIEDMIAKSKASEKKVENMEDELSSYRNVLEKHKSSPGVKLGVLLEKEKIIGGLEGQGTELQNEVERLKDQLTKTTQARESKDALLNMQRQEIGKQEVVLKIYETKLQAKGRDFPQIVARAEEGDRVWSKIEEREKNFAAKEMLFSEMGAENAILRVEKKRLQSEVKELKQCFELYELNLNGTDDKVHMPWLLAQLRESVSLKEKAVELEEVIQGEGYTVKAKEAESAYKEKERVMALEMEKLRQIVDSLRGQTTGAQDMEVPVLLGKLEECIHEFGQGGKPFDDIVSTTSSDMTQSMSLNTNNSFIEEGEKSPGGICISTSDFEDLMHPNHYAIMTSLAAGFDYTEADVLCSPVNPEEDVEEDEEFGPGEVDCGDKDEYEKAVATDAEKSEACQDGVLSDIHLEKVIRILQRNEDNSL